MIILFQQEQGKILPPSISLYSFKTGFIGLTLCACIQSCKNEHKQEYENRSRGSQNDFTNTGPAVSFCRIHASPS